ncbi:23S rRNA (pseudouridine(1915)-N(3))-methyltransferase RlmH [Candidatus Woesearchaeota archaeon]|nr:MAG: 23S rRNA (pseudouridine(1915)-N(3))-methyltransferase RlmH [Candidatus Woesearchaeota archaeon]
MIQIISVGKLKEKFYVQAFEEYFKRTKKYAKIENIEAKTINQAFKLAKHDIVLLDENGKTFTSLKFASFIKDKNLSFIIGPAEGFSDKEKVKAKFKLSLSSMTYPHELAKVMLMEQVYRAFTILNNLNYHKE